MQNESAEESNQTSYYVLFRRNIDSQDNTFTLLLN